MLSPLRRLATVVTASLMPLYAHAQVKSDEEVVFFPSAAHLSDDGAEWVVTIHGWVFEEETNSLLRRAALYQFRKRLGLDAEDETTAMFEHRMRRFLVDNERGKRAKIELAGRTYTMPESGADGHFSMTLRIPVGDVRDEEAGGRLEFHAVLAEDDDRMIRGRIHLVSNEGVTVISDIDDTIKVSHVTDRHELVRSTFFKPFEAVEGMAELYAGWAEQGAEFHFVSASPWQLYEPLSTFTQEAGFPDAAWSMKQIRLKDSTLLKLFDEPYAAKLAVIGDLVSASPRRRFVLVGDSGEKDPEVYGELARRHPERILRVLIRNVTDETSDSERMREAFRDVGSETWQLFDGADEIETDLPD